MSLRDVHNSKGAILAQDGIPLHYGDLLAEYQAALQTAILLDRSHEGRIQIFGKDRFELLNRMSTNQMIHMAQDEGRPTIFINANARIIDRIFVYNRGDHLLVVTEPGQGQTITDFIQRQIFFNDDVRLLNITPKTAQFALHGPSADAVLGEMGFAVGHIKDLHGTNHYIDGTEIFAGRKKSVSGLHWIIVCAIEDAEKVYQSLLLSGESYGIIPAGSLTYNTLRIRAGRPARPELNSDYIPLEIGLWDEVNFSKGCYTGQEIIARMESRGQLAKTIVSLSMQTFVQAPSEITLEGNVIGKLTSSVEAPDGKIFTMGIIRTKVIKPNLAVMIGQNQISAIIQQRLGVQPDIVSSE